jgi:hypothetical protein
MALVRLYTGEFIRRCHSVDSRQPPRGNIDDLIP